ncbi:polyketide cyclase [Nocardia brasiliensis]|uniref:Polyketide cyclase n=2 Tax=Nocardia brasiliensis TaxID=37326 RepID=A0A6G9Y2R8_NOCBR|nr:polyketide cyclase [Nocardia brasiliensis]
MEYGRIERSLYIDAAPEVVYEVVSSPEHLREWWSDDASLAPAPGAVGELVWGDRDGPDAFIAPLTVVDARPPELFSFRWGHPADEPADSGNSLFVTFELTPSGTGTTLRMTEVGFRERGWGIAELEQAYNDHIAGWNRHLPDLAEYAAKVGAAR